MVIDFSKLIPKQDEKPVQPREIFLSLNRHEKYSFPRDIQTEVWNQWFEKRNDPYNIIKLNVGSGKTLVGLLILQSSVNEGKGPGLYVAPNNQLRDQVIGEAKLLGIDVTDDPKDQSYLSGDKICITNVHKVFNGQSVFGVKSSKIEIGTIIIDDAHACISTIESQFRVQLSNQHSMYPELFKLFEEDIKIQSHPVYLEIRDNDPRGYCEIPFWAWKDKVTKVQEIFHPHRYSAEESISFTYPLVMDDLENCRCVISGDKIEIQPTFPNIDLIRSFENSARKIFMTATLSDDSILATHFGVAEENLPDSISPTSSQTIGERMILMPQQINPDLKIEMVRKMLKRLSTSVNVIVVVPSAANVTDWSNEADQILIGENVESGVDKLRRGHVGLTVLVNRYDGIDLPKDACRVLAIVGLPEANSLLEKVDSELMESTQTVLRRQSERIEQGMGRGIRSSEDYCAVLLLGEKLIERLIAAEREGLFNPATQKQLELSRQIAYAMDDQSIEGFESVISQCLERDPSWVQASKQFILNLPPLDSQRPNCAGVYLRLAYDQARLGRYENAVEFVDRSIKSESDDSTHSWLLFHKASFQHHINPADAQGILSKARECNFNLPKPIVPAKYKKISPAMNQANNLIENHNRFLQSTDQRLFVNRLIEDLRYDPELSHKTFEGAVDDLAHYIGINGTRPENQYNDGGPDNLWALPNKKFLVIECKNEATSQNGISKDDAGQLGQSVEWFREKYPEANSTPFMLHPKSYLDPKASAVKGMRVLNHEHLDNLRGSLRQFSKSLASSNGTYSIENVRSLLDFYNFEAEKFVSRYSTEVK